MKNRTPVLLGYDLAIAKAKELHRERHDTEHGAIAWLAGEIGVTRQTIDNWSDRDGIPPKYVSKVAEVLGMKAETVRPDVVLVQMPRSIWDYVSMLLMREMLENQVTVIPPRKR